MTPNLGCDTLNPKPSRPKTLNPIYRAVDMTPNIDGYPKLKPLYRALNLIRNIDCYRVGAIPKVQGSGCRCTLGLTV